ncbi:uncharacterized protein PG998_007731 [Apiospora kogelbergensis]|uniref:Uncharacterized protein n=1 Tax=Apiospora kogelbergensis TaxID=1337665 RepID=A0AAW0QNV7_9PEZI
MSPTSSCTPCSGTTAFPREVLLPNSDDSGSEATQFDIIMLENNGEIISDPASLSAEENLINETESDVNALIKLPEPLQRFMRSTPPEPTMPSTIASKTLGFLTKPKGPRVEKPRSKKKAAKRNERRLRAIQAQAEALLTDPDSDAGDTKSPTFECRDEWAAVQRGCPAYSGALM